MPSVLKPASATEGPRTSTPGGAHLRLSSVDHLRGLVMVLMALDHTREYFMNYVREDPTNLATTYPLLFFTRWLTHYCAPVFVFLAGTGAFLAYARGKSKRGLAAFLVTRGLWLMLLEITLVKLGMTFRFDTSSFLIQVIGAIGASMVLLAVVVALPAPAVGALGLAIMVGHNLFDGPLAGVVKALGPASVLLRPGARHPVPGTMAIFAYPVIPWFGVMAAGYGFGTLLLWPHYRRRRVILGLGLALTLAFLVLRWLSVYGDPKPWSRQPSWPMTVVSFLNCEKYPPSLLYLLMTLGPALMLLAWFDGGAGVVGRRLVTLGRVPLFYYLLQWPVIHGLAVAYALALGEPVGWLFRDAPFNPPRDYGHGLTTVYVAWAVAVVLLYIPCRWFAELKRTRRDVWLSYL